jgi:ACS family 4-hydroxyphenylacetate permease-like MFS transporter
MAEFLLEGGMVVATEARTQLATDVAFENRVIRKAFRHLISFLFILYVISFLDRINVGFAALSMNKELELTATMFGFSNTIFYAGYALCEIPSNLCLKKYGARKWLARILITWGLASAGTMFAVGPKSFYAFRLLLGVFEAGFLPGAFLYLTYWFPSTYRARAISVFTIAMPVSTILSATVSGLILDHTNGFLGLAGWRWLFLIEGLPATLLGFVTYFYLSDGPADAKWLTDEEKSALQRRLEREQVSAAAHGGSGKQWSEVFSRKVILLGLTYFFLLIGLGATSLWVPQITRDVMRAHNFSYVGLLTAGPQIIAIIVMLLWGAHSDKKMERTWHFVLPVLFGSFGWALIGLSGMPAIRMLGLTITATLNTAMSIFWTVPPRVLSANACPVGIAFISTCGMISTSINPLVFGLLRDWMHSWTASVLYVAAMLLVSVPLMLMVAVKENVPPMGAASE